jgi:MFS family permease
MNIVYALAAYPIGWLSDHLPRVWFVIVGFITLIAADIVLAYGADLRAAFSGIVLWGLHLGLSQGVLAAMVVDTCPQEWRATAFGVFNVLSAAALLIANPLAGILWDRAGGQTTFLIAAALAVLGALGLLLSYRNWRGAVR